MTRKRKTVSDWLTADDDSNRAERAREHSISQEEGPPPGRSGYVTDEDLEATQHRIKTGLPALPMAGWRW